MSKKKTSYAVLFQLVLLFHYAHLMFTCYLSSFNFFIAPSGIILIASTRF